MRVTIKKDINVDDKTKLFKNTEGILIGVSWKEEGDDMYYVQVKDKRYTVDKKYCDLY
jgi:hypothetical protein